MGRTGLAQQFRRWKHSRRLERAQRECERRLAKAQRSDLAHKLERPLVVSVTSDPARFPVLKKTLNCLLLHSILPDHLILWLSAKDVPHLPPSVLALRDLGLEIRGTEDLRSYTKIITTLAASPDAYVVTADDDVYYWPTWLEELVTARHQSGDPVICHRGHLIRLDEDASPAPYTLWHRGIRRATTSPRLFLTGALGVFYDARVFHHDVTRRDLFQTLCPHADDVWLYWMHRLNGISPRVLSCRHRVLE